MKRITTLLALRHIGDFLIVISEVLKMMMFFSLHARLLP